MHSIANEIDSIAVGEASHVGSLTLFPLFRTNEPPTGPDYTLLEDAIAQGSANVTEVSATGSVPDLQFSNIGHRPVLPFFVVHSMRSDEPAMPIDPRRLVRASPDIWQSDLDGIDLSAAQLKSQNILAVLF